MPSIAVAPTLARAAALFHALSDQTRLEILSTALQPSAQRRELRRTGRCCG